MDRRAQGRVAALPAVAPVRSGGVTLQVRRLPAGEGRRPPGRAPRLMLLHGGPGLDHHLLLPLGMALAGRYEVWLPDLPGHGASQGQGGAAPGLRALEERLGRWLRGVFAGEAGPAASWVLVGHSLGAWLVREQLTAGGAARAVGAAILLAPPAAGQRARGTALRRAGDLMRRRREPRARSDVRARRDVLAHVEAESAGEVSPLFEACVAAARLRDPRAYPQLTAELHRRLVGAPRRFEPDCPVLVLCGERDLTTPVEQARRVADGLAGARLERVPEAGHYLYADAPEATLAAIEGFLEGAGLSAPGS